MKKLRKDKGITLIALIITIIVLLILALVTINAIQGDGDLIAHAQNAGTKYTAEGENENAVVQNSLAKIEKYLNEKIKVYYINVDDTIVYINLEKTKAFWLSEGIWYYSGFRDINEVLEEPVKDENNEIIIPTGETIWYFGGSGQVIMYNDKIFVFDGTTYREPTIVEVETSLFENACEFAVE